MPNVFEYLNYREFIRDFYDERKARNPQFSYQVFSSKAGITSRGFLHNVIAGKRNISTEHVLNLSRAMGFQKNEARYFEALVAFNQAKSDKERQHNYQKLLSVTGYGDKERIPQRVRKDQFEYYSRMHHSVVRSLVAMGEFRDDYEWLARSVYPRISVPEAKKSVKLLERLGLIERGGDGVYFVTDRRLTTGKEVQSLAVRKFHVQSGNLALRAIEELPKSRRFASGLTLGVSEETYNEICDEIYRFRMKILSKITDDRQADRVYQLNLQLFPVADLQGNSDQ